MAGQARGQPGSRARAERKELIAGAMGRSKQLEAREDLGSTSHATTPSDFGRSRERLKLPAGSCLWAAGMGERWKGEGQGHHKVSNGLSQS